MFRSFVGPETELEDCRWAVMQYGIGSTTVLFLSESSTRIFNVVGLSYISVAHAT